MSTTLPQSVSPTATKPLVVVSTSPRNQTFVTKIWRVVDHQTLDRQHIPNSPYVRLEELWSCKAPFGKNNINLETNINWSVPKRVTRKHTSVALVQYNKLDQSFTTPEILSPVGNKIVNPLPQPIEEYIAFALNPAHQFSHLQTRAIYSQLRSSMPAGQLAQFLQLWPNANKDELEEEVEQPELLNYPSTLKEAYKCFMASRLASNAGQSTQANQATQVEQTCVEPDPRPMPLPPSNAPYVLHNLQAVNFRTGRSLKVGTYKLSVQTIQQGKHNARREVFYADAIPISPLKATVAVLYADMQPESKTFQQPIIKSINIAKATAKDIAEFLQEHRIAMNEQQLAEFKPNPSQTTDHQFQPSQPKGEPLMSLELQNCAECEVEFMPPRSSSRFCCEQCRVAYYSKSRRKINTEQSQRHSPTQPQTGPSMEQFEALAAQVGQLVQLLTNKG